MPPEYNPIIDHPVQAGWLSHGRDIFDSKHKAMLTERFADTGESIEAVLSAVALAGSITDGYRMSHEAQSRGELDLNEPQRNQQYSDLAGRPERVGEFISWFGTIAAECFEHASTRRDLLKIGLELGGMRQAGDWSGTGPLDDMAKSIPSILPKIDPSAKVRILERGKAVQKNYVILPLGHVVMGRYDPNFEFALIRRRRGAADVHLNGKYPIQIFKESSAVVAINKMDETDVTLLRKAYLKSDNLPANKKRNSSPAGVAGREFERSIRFKRERSLTTIPISAHYVMVMHRQS